jgi:flagellar hook-associated protein 2
MSTSALNLFNATSNSNSSSGLGAGIDVASVVNQILQADRAPEQVWQSQQSDLQNQASALNTINSYLSDFSSKTNALKDTFGALASKSVTSSQPTVVGATAQASAAPGTHTITVTNTASTSSYYTDVVPTGGTFANGTFSIQVGHGSANPITIDSTNNTVQSLASFVNGNTQTLGVSANVVNDANGSRLVLVSNTSGLPGDLTLSGSLKLASDNSTVGTTKIAGANASFSLDGIPLTSSSNTVNNVISGVTLNLLSGSSGSTVQLSVSSDTGGASDAVNAFVSSYNTLLSAINAQFAVTAGSSAPPLEANSSVRELQSDLLSNMTYSLAGNNGFTSLASLGINMNNDGTLSVDSSQLTNVLQNNFGDFQNFFQSSDASNQGFAVHLGSTLLNLTDPTQGILNVELTQNSATQQMLTSQINDFEDRLAVTRQQLTTEYSQMNTALETYSTTMSQLQSELNSLPKAGA